jgi:hypothetical protein
LPLAESGNGDDSPPTADELIRNGMKLSDRNRMIHLLSDISVIGKAVDGLLEIAGGLLLFFMNPEQLNWLVRASKRSSQSDGVYEKFGGKYS